MVPTPRPPATAIGGTVFRVAAFLAAVATHSPLLAEPPAVRTAA